MKQYESYKDSSIHWWGVVPSHWDLLKAKHMFSLITESVSDSSLPKVALENIESGTGRFIPTESDFMGEGVEFETDDILFGKLRPYLAKVYKAEFRGQSVGDIYVFRGKITQTSGFLKYLLLSYPFISVVDGSTYGAKMPRANWDFISHMILPCPPIKEQEVIASYLDYKVGQIDTAISEKEQMLDDLKAYRSAIISEAVTKGLDKDVEMKDSGIDWIDTMPKHWKKMKIKNLSNLQSGSNLVSEQILETGMYPVFGGNGIRGYYNEYNVEGDHVLIGRQGALCGNINIAAGKFWATEHAIVCYPIADYNTEWFAALLESMNLNQYSQSAAQPGLSVEKIKNLFIPVPSKEEQDTIGTYLSQKDKQICQSISETQSQIDDLKAYKSSIITEAVTGKVDLREWKPK